MIACYPDAELFEARLKHHWRFARHVSCSIQQMGQSRFGMATSRSSRSRPASKLLGLTVGAVCANNVVGRVDGPHKACKQLRETFCCFFARLYSRLPSKKVPCMRDLGLCLAPFASQPCLTRHSPARHQRLLQGWGCPGRGSCTFPISQTLLGETHLARWATPH